MENQLVDVTNEIKANGKIRYVFKTNDGQESFTIEGEYLEVQEGERLNYTWNWKSDQQLIDNGDYKLNIEFLQNGDNSRLIVKQENLDSEEAIKPHQEGWEKALNELTQYLEGSITNGNSSANAVSQGGADDTQKTGPANSDVTGYNEIAEQEKVGGYSN